MVVCPFHTKRWPLNPQLLPTPDAPRATATRDLQELVEIDAFTRTGERRYTRYWLKLEGPDV